MPDSLSLSKKLSSTVVFLKILSKTETSNLEQHFNIVDSR